MGFQVPRGVAYGIVVVLMACHSGGLLFGTAPFQSALQAQFGFTVARAERVLGQALQLFIFGSAAAAPAVDALGPRVSASLGLAMEACGLWAVAGAAQATDAGLAVSLGALGIGGNMFTYGAMTFPMLFKNSDPAAASYDSALTSWLTGMYQVSGFVFALLSFVDFAVFFKCYAALAAASAILAFALFPNSVYASSEDSAQFKFRRKLSLPAAGLCGGSNGLADLRVVLSSLRTWLFFLGYGVCATSGVWGLVIFQGVVMEQQGYNEHMANQLTAWMPIVANATFVFAPLVGMLIDAKGFAPAILSQCFWVAAFAALIWRAPLGGQWGSLLALNLLNCHVYAIQFSYINKTYSGENFGLVMSLSCLAQSAINPLALAWSSADRGTAAVVFTGLALLICGPWAVVQWRLRAKNLETSVDCKASDAGSDNENTTSEDDDATLSAEVE